MPTDTIVTIDGAPAPAAFADHVAAQHARSRALRNCPGCCSGFDYPHGATCTLDAALLAGKAAP